METNEISTVSLTEYIGRLPGVINSSIVMNGNDITELHILSDISRAPKQLVRDVQSLLMAQFNKEIDHKVVSIAQIDFPSVVSPPSRLSVEEVSVSRKKDGTEIRVALSRQDVAYTGSALCSNDKVEIYRAISQATLDAVLEAQHSKQKFTALDVRLTEIANSMTVLACVSLKTGSGESCRFCGSSFVSDDEETAVVRATLSAINRRLSLS